jgi:DNA polymerase-3 subunit gamma/tau
MSYQVLARKWRPRNFDELVGQEHVLKALVHALDHDRLHHAFLFTGTRGVGKTTIARILAKSLNCEAGVSSKPCGQCSTCKEIDEGRFVDLIEVDAASRTKVDETRDLLDNVQYAPTRGRFKVYLIDEVHMFSNSSFNALLKTLEEPPPHVKFLLATTDPQKLPVTILSRCLQFNLRRLPADLIQNHLSHIVAQEGVEAELAGLDRLSRAADGSMRDALSLLDQGIAYGDGKVLEADITSMLGSIEKDHIYQLLEALISGESAQLFAVVNELAQQAPDYSDVLAELITTLHYLALIQQVPEAWDERMGDQARLNEIAQKVSAADLQLYYQIALKGRRDLPLSPEPRTGLEMTLLRMLAFKPAEPVGKNQVGKSQVGKNAALPPAEKKTIASTDSTSESGSPAKTQSSAPLGHQQSENEAAATSMRSAKATEWYDIVAELNIGGALQQAVANCVLIKQHDDFFHLALAPSSAPLWTKGREDTLARALSDYLGRPIKLQVELKEVDGESPAARDSRLQAERQLAAQTAIENDPNVQSLIEAFDAKIQPNSVEPID